MEPREQGAGFLGISITVGFNIHGALLPAAGGSLLPVLASGENYSDPATSI